MQDIKLPKTDIKLPKTDAIKPEPLKEAEPKPEIEVESNVIYVKAGQAHTIDYSKLKPGTNVIVTYDN
jgi:hypothetical protein